MTTTTDHQPLTEQQLAEIEAHDYRRDRNGAAAYRQSDLAAQDVPALLAEVKRLQAKLTETETVAREKATAIVEVCAGAERLLKRAETAEARLREADTKFSVLADIHDKMLGECARHLPASAYEGHEIPETAVLAWLRDTAAEAERTQAVRDLHSPFRVYDDCCHEHKETDKNVTDVAEIGIVCEDGYMYTVCRHCCTDAQGFQTEACVSSHDHSDTGNRDGICPTRRAINGEVAQ